MQRFILRFPGPGAPPPEDLAAIRTAPGIAVVDTAPAMVLVDAALPDLERLRTQLPAWSLTAERYIPLPHPKRPRPKS